MFKITNIESLGADYTVTDQSGKHIKTIQVLTHTDILEAALGPFNESFKTIDSYLEQSISVLSGVDKVDPLTVLWFTTEEEEVVLSELIEYAVKFGYDKIVIEYLDPLE